MNDRTSLSDCEASLAYLNLHCSYMTQRRVFSWRAQFYESSSIFCFYFKLHRLLNAQNDKRKNYEIEPVHKICILYLIIETTFSVPVDEEISTSCK